MSNTNIKKLEGRSYRRAIKEAKKELTEAFHFDLRTASDSLIEELCGDYFLKFNEDGTIRS